MCNSRITNSCLMFTEVNIWLNVFPIYIQKIITLTEVFGSRWENIKLCEYTMGSPFSM